MNIFGNHNEQGQTLIETLAAIFILTMGITAAVGLANYALNSSAAAAKQIIATGLAREGIEAVKNMRDTNWLQGTMSSGCTGFPSGTANCYPAWDTTPYCIDSGGNNGGCSGNSGPNYFLQFDASNISTSFWKLIKVNGNSGKFGLLYNPDPSTSNNGFYYTGNGGTSCTSGASNLSDYCRSISISQNGSAPFDKPDQTDVGPELIVTSDVWWIDRKCPRAQDYTTAPVSCKIEIKTYLTNWKNYSL